MIGAMACLPTKAFFFHFRVLSQAAVCLAVAVLLDPHALLIAPAVLLLLLRSFCSQAEQTQGGGGIDETRPSGRGADWRQNWQADVAVARQHLLGGYLGALFGPLFRLMATRAKVETSMGTAPMKQGSGRVKSAPKMLSLRVCVVFALVLCGSSPC